MSPLTTAAETALTDAGLSAVNFDLCSPLTTRSREI